MLFGVGLFADGGGSAIAVVVFYRVGGGGQNTIKDT
jgi:hypothetical protein